MVARATSVDLNVHVPAEDINLDVKGTLYKELEHVFHKRIKYNIKFF
jgi:hypothetical protein